MVRQRVPDHEVAALARDLATHLQANAALSPDAAARLAQGVAAPNLLDLDVVEDPAEILGPSDEKTLAGLRRPTALPKTEFDLTTGLPIVHSRKVYNYRVNVRRLYKNADLHEIILDILESSLALPRTLYRCLRFLISESKITLTETQSLIYFLLWQEKLDRWSTTEAFRVITHIARDTYGRNMTSSAFEEGLDQLTKLGLLRIQDGCIRIEERPRARSR